MVAARVGSIPKIEYEVRSRRAPRLRAFLPLAIGFLLSCLTLSAQPPSALLSNGQVTQLCGRMVELMEAEGVAISDLQRASAPVIEATRQNCLQLQIEPGRAAHTFALLSNVRAYLTLADALPKPFPFPEAAERQFTELRDDFMRLDSHFRALTVAEDARLVNPDPANLARYAEANRLLAAPHPDKPRVVFFGDWITDFWRLNEYFPDSDYVNRGISGQTTGEMLQRFQADVVSLHPEAVLILAGTNDLARGISVGAIENNYLAMATLAQAGKIKVIFASVTPVSDYHKDQNPAYERTPGRPPALDPRSQHLAARPLHQSGISVCRLFFGSRGWRGAGESRFRGRRPASERHGISRHGPVGSRRHRQSRQAAGCSTGRSRETSQALFAVYY